MDENVQTLLIQVVSLSILLIALLQAMMLFIQSVKHRIQGRKTFELELALLQQTIEHQVLATDLLRQKNDHSWLGFRKFSIQKKEFENNTGICSFYLTPHDGKPIPAFKPGQHLFFRVNIPGQKKPLLRCYSISSSPYTREYYRISIKKELPPLDKPSAPPGIVSSYFYDNLKQGDIVDVRAPSGKFTIDLLSHKPVVMVGSGIGITPLLSMLYAICDSGAQRETWFFLGVKNKQSYFMQEQLTKISVEYENIQIFICYSQPLRNEVEGRDYDHSERVSVELLKKHLPSNNFEFYFCGPNSMIESFRKDLADWGVPEKYIHYERFVKPEIQKKIERLTVDNATATVRFSKSQLSLNWSEEGDSILDLALSNGINIDYSCRRGMCGLCQTTIKAGEVYYDEEPEYLSDLEQGMCLPCVAKTKKDLELYA